MLVVDETGVPFQDDDSDGDIDLILCAFDPACGGGGLEDCTNGIDDDNNGQVDYLMTRYAKSIQLVVAMGVKPIAPMVSMMMEMGWRTVMTRFV